MKKKKGSTLVVVLGILFALSITGIAVFTYVKGTSKTNNIAINKIKTEALAKSAINEAEFEYIKGNTKEEEISKTVLNSLNDKLDGFSLDIKIGKETDTKYKIEAISKFKETGYEAKETTFINVKKNESNNENDIDLFMKSAAGISILNSGKVEFNYRAPVAITGTTINIANYYGDADSYLKGNGNFTYNNKNLNIEGEERSKGLNLKLKKGDINISGSDSEFEDSYLYIRNYRKGTVALLNGDDDLNFKDIGDITKEDLKENCGAIVKLSGDRRLILSNGNINLNRTKLFSECFIYAKNKFIISDISNGEFHKSNVITDNGMIINGNLNYNTYFDNAYYDEVKEYLKKFI